MPRYRDGRSDMITTRIFSYGIVAVDRRDDVAAVPCDNGIAKFVQSVRNFASVAAAFPDPDNLLALLGGIFNFPIYPITIFRVFRNVHHHDAAGFNSRRQYFTLDIFGRFRVVEFVGGNRVISHCHAGFLQQGFQVGEAGIVFVDVADKGVLGVVCHLLFLSHSVAHRPPRGGGGPLQYAEPCTQCLGRWQDRINVGAREPVVKTLWLSKALKTYALAGGPGGCQLDGN